MSTDAGSPEVEICGVCKSARIRLDSGVLVCQKCDDWKVAP